MTYEKAEMILEQLMARDRDLYLVAKDARPFITDRPTKDQKIVDCLKGKKRVKWLQKAVAILLSFFVMNTPVQTCRATRITKTTQEVYLDT